VLLCFVSSSLTCSSWPRVMACGTMSPSRWNSLIPHRLRNNLSLGMFYHCLTVVWLFADFILFRYLLFMLFTCLFICCLSDQFRFDCLYYSVFRFPIYWYIIFWSDSSCWQRGVPGTQSIRPLWIPLTCEARRSSPSSVHSSAILVCCCFCSFFLILCLAVSFRLILSFFTD
jgi:hypothetical protein